MTAGGRPAAPAGARLVLATRNLNKVRELRQILADALGDAARAVDPAVDPAVSPAVDLDAAVVGAADLHGVEDVRETGVTFAENALLKARAVSAATGLPAVADDSGLAVEVLGGAPGVFSARWAGRHGDDTANLELLLAQVADVPDEHRAAAFVCAAALVVPGGPEVVEHGRLEGTLEHGPRGEGGFGYDPVLRPLGETRTCAELTAAEKNAISHRGQAVRALVPRLVELLT
ncbi:non-canonical purine NTP pyrophosphatase [Thalassiella azotivora]